MPLVVFSAEPWIEDLSEFDQCSLCGAATVYLAWIRHRVELLGICQECAEMLLAAHNEMRVRRAAWEASH